jgi:hypothetical protein
MRVYSHHVLMNTDTSDFFTLTYYYTYALSTYADNSRSRYPDLHRAITDPTHLGLIQQLWPPNQQAHDPDSWTAPHLLQLKMEYEVLVNN